MPASQALLFPDPRPLVERLGQDFFRQLPERPGVYLMRDASGMVLYVGKARNLRKRLNSYRVANPDRLRRRHLRLLRAVEHIDLEECPDETAALVREAELLLSLKPRFNRAGVWQALPRFHLVWRCQEHGLELAIAETIVNDWQAFGPFGNSIAYFRAALARLLWQATHPDCGSAGLPFGWIHGKMDSIAIVVAEHGRESKFAGMEAALENLFAGNPETFVNWVDERTQTLIHFYDHELRDSDLETVLEFVQAKFRRTKSVVVTEPTLVARQTVPHPVPPLATLDDCLS